MASEDGRVAVRDLQRGDPMTLRCGCLVTRGPDLPHLGHVAVTVVQARDGCTNPHRSLGYHAPVTPGVRTQAVKQIDDEDEPTHAKDTLF